MSEITFKFAKPPKKAKKPIKRINRVRKTPLAVLKRQADKLAGDNCRARGYCEKCKTTKGVLQWAHIISRTYHSIRWLSQNSLCLCSKCHCLFTNRPDEWIAFLMKNFQDTYLYLYSKKNEYVKIDRKFKE